MHCGTCTDLSRLVGPKNMHKNTVMALWVLVEGLVMALWHLHGPKNMGKMHVGGEAPLVGTMCTAHCKPFGNPLAAAIVGQENMHSQNSIK